jgi:hypothetical protein
MRENDVDLGGESTDLTGGRFVKTEVLMRQLAITERAMVLTHNSADRRRLVQQGCGVSEHRARRLVRSVEQLWKLRAAAFGTPSKARVKLLPMAQAVYSKAMESGNLNAAINALKLQAELCGLRGPDLVIAPATVGQAHGRAERSNESVAVAQRVLERLMVRSAQAKNEGNGHGSNGNGHGIAKA